LNRDSDRVEFEDGCPVTYATTLYEFEDSHRIDPSEYEPGKEYRADSVATQIWDHVGSDEDESNSYNDDRMTAGMVSGAAIYTAETMSSRLSREWTEYWIAGEGAAPDAERMVKGTTAYLLMVILPLAMTFSFFF